MRTTLTNAIPDMPSNFGASFGFIQAPLDSVADATFAWRGDLGFDPLRVDLGEGLVANARSLLPLAPAPVFRDLFVGTASGEWTAYFNANPFGGDPGGTVRHIGRKLGAATITITSVPFQKETGAVSDNLGGVIFAYAPNAAFSAQRSIALVEGESSSSRYHFETWGPEQPWEATERYTARRKRDRFDPALLEQYCKELGIDVFNLDFYAGPSVLIERTNL